MAEERSSLMAPRLMPLGDSAILIRFADRLTLEANAAAIAFSRNIRAADLSGVIEIVPNLVSVLVRYDPQRIGYNALCGEIRIVGASHTGEESWAPHRVPIFYGGEHGPDLAAVAESLGLDMPKFIELHSAASLTVLSTGFAPGFVYCGLHSEALSMPRREAVRSFVPPGSVLFAARQTAIAATSIPTGWSVIGRTKFINFDPGTMPPTRIRAGDKVTFEVAS